MDDDLAKVNPSLLRGAATGCPRRLALEHIGQRGTRQPDTRFRISDAFDEHARLAQLELGVPRADAFSGSAEFTPEERALYEHAVGWYLAIYGKTVARALDLGDDRWARPRPDLGVRLTSRPPLVFESDGPLELRVLRYNGRPPPADLLADEEIAIDVLRFAHLAPGHLRIGVSDVVRGEHHGIELDPTEIVPQLDDWLGDAIGALRAAVDKDSPRIGPDCGWCTFVAGCKAHVA